MLRAVPIERLTALATQMLTQMLTRLEPPPAHPARKHIHATHSRGERIADAVAETMGSWRFIIGQSVFVGLWILLNLVAAALRWDPYPFILLNLLFSTQAAYAAPIIMMSQNRQSAKDRIRDDTEASEVEQLFQINQQQLLILQQQNEILALLKAHAEPAKHATKAKKETAAA